MRIFPLRLDLVMVATYVSGASPTIVCAKAEAQALTSCPAAGGHQRHHDMQAFAACAFQKAFKSGFVVAAF